jgi:hypothetical protein
MIDPMKITIRPTSDKMSGKIVTPGLLYRYKKKCCVVLNSHMPKWSQLA